MVLTHDFLKAARAQLVRERPRGLLWRGDALAEYQLWRRRHAVSLTPLEAAFGAASVADAARGRRIRRAIVALAFVTTAVFVVALLVSYPWYVLTLGSLAYLACLPLGWFSYQRYMQADAAASATALSDEHEPPVAAPQPPSDERPARLN